MKKTRVVAAMSGGVDSAVAAAILQKQGFEVIGISMQIWADYCTPGERSCCSPSHLDDARAVAEILNIPYYAINFQAAFEDKVINPFCQEYFAGRTPSPCIVCNHELKFKLLLEKAKSLGAEYVATGHYARINFDDQSKRFQLKRGSDINKDQSYFLFSLNQEMLAHTLFPLWEYEKPQIREIAQQLNLPVAAKKESQEICFIPDSGYKEFLQNRYPGKAVRGDALDVDGNKLGEHEGIAFYTIGQRRGLGISAPHPLYVVKIDAQKNTVTLGKETDLYQSSLIAKGGNLENIMEPLKVLAQIRYRHKAAQATVTPLGSEEVLVEFEEPQSAITPGQAVVFYQGDTVVGGSWIEVAGNTRR